MGVTRLQSIAKYEELIDGAIKRINRLRSTEEIYRNKIDVLKVDQDILQKIATVRDSIIYYELAIQGAQECISMVQQFENYER